MSLHDPAQGGLQGYSPPMPAAAGPLGPSDPRYTPSPALVDQAVGHEAMTPLALYFGLRGRVRRRTFWLHGVVALLLAGAVGTALLQIAGWNADEAQQWVDALLVWPVIAISVKRWHDIDRPGWFVLVNLVPAVGQLIALVCNGFFPGTVGENRFGGDPKTEPHGPYTA